MKICGRRGCPDLTDGGPYCPTHSPEPWEGSDRRSELPSDWPRRRRRIIKRDRGICQWPTGDGRICGHHGTDVDHKQPGNNHSDSNLWLLCHDHHASKTGREGNAARQQPRNHPL